MTKKILVVLFLIFSCAFSKAQEKWISSAQLDLVFPNKSEYFYINSQNHIFDDDSNYHGFLLRSFALQADYNYLLFKKLSLGVLGGLQTQTDPSYSFLKLGGILKYYFVDKNEIYVYLNAGHNFSLNRDKFRNGANARFGLAFPFLKREGYSLVFHVFKEYNVFDIEGTKPLYGGTDEIPRSFTVRSFGISFGVQF